MTRTPGLCPDLQDTDPVPSTLRCSKHQELVLGQCVALALEDSDTSTLFFHL